jgi:3-oxoacyl-[acyl-carrier-protein] synthase II
MRRRVVITGLGMVTPIGTGRAEFWPRLLAGASAAADVQAFDTSRHRVHRACEVRDFDFEQVVGAPAPLHAGPASRLATAAAHLALLDGALEIADLDPLRIGVCVGTRSGEIHILEARDTHAATSGEPGTEDCWIPQHAACVIPATIAHWFGLAGPNLTIPTASAAGNFALGYAADLIRDGEADAMLAGGVDVLSRVAFTGFARLGCLAPDCCQPFDRNRRGFLLGEGAGIVLLEAAEHARARGSRPWAELLGYGLTSDARHGTSPDPDGEGIARAMRLALRDAGCSAGDVDYICAHGTGTRVNDLAETRAAKRVFGKRARKVPLSSIKSMLGHAMGAASAIETIACALAIAEGAVPPTIHYESPDPECDLDYVANRWRPLRPRVVLNNALGLGGINSSLTLGRVEDGA